MTTLREILKTQGEWFAEMGHPQIIEQFVMKHGVEYVGLARPKGVRRRVAKECFSNAAKFSSETGADYVEGYALRTDFPLPVLHAWNVLDGRMIDTTLDDPRKFEYLGVRFTRDEVWAELARTKIYGLFDTGGVAANVDFLRRRDPELVAACFEARKTAQKATG
jgi:hypothetical protein